jgi:Na+-driven multidrug efflux pump
VNIATFALRAQVLMFPFVPTNVACNMSYQSTGKSWTATFLSSARQGFFFLPAIWILPNLLGITGVQLAQPVADICTFILAVPFAVRFYRLLNEKEREYEHAEA